MDTIKIILAVIGVIAVVIVGIWLIGIVSAILWFGLWIGFATFLSVSEYVFFCTVFTVGIVAGLTYVNTVYMILNDNRIDKGEKEVCLNVNGMFSDSGVVLSSICGFFFKRMIN